MSDYDHKQVSFKKILLDCWDVAGAAALTVWAFAALGVPAGLPFWRVATGMLLLSVAFKVMGRRRQESVTSA